MRIEPLPNKRRRALFLYNNKEIDEELFGSIKNLSEALETLFIFGTKTENLSEIMATLEKEKQDVLLGDLFEINPAVKNKPLLIPKYRISDKIIVEEKELVKFHIHPDDYKTAKVYFNYIGEKIALIKYDCDVKVLLKVKEGFNGSKNDLFFENEEQVKIDDAEFLLQSIFKHFSNNSEEFDAFKKLQEEIIHFKRINISKEKLNSLREKIEKVKKSKDKNVIKNELKEKLKNEEIDIDEYTTQIENISTNLLREAETTYETNERLKIKYNILYALCMFFTQINVDK